MVASASLAAESMSAETDDESAAGRSVSAHARAESKKAGSRAAMCWPWPIAAGTTTKASPSTVTKNPT